MRPSERRHYAPRFCGTLNFSAGRERSLRPAATRHHFITGAQKNTVFGPDWCTALWYLRRACGAWTRSFAAEADGLGQRGSRRVTALRDAPAGWFMNAEKRDAPTDAAGPDIVRCAERLGTVRTVTGECAERGEWADVSQLLFDAWVRLVEPVSFPGCMYVKLYT